MKVKLLFIFPVLLLFFSSFYKSPTFKIAKLKYSGGGDWYANRTALPNLIDFCNKNLQTNLAPQEDIVEVGSPEIFHYPFIYMTGHGNVVFNTQEAGNLRNYLIGGGFIHIDDNYGLDKFVRTEMKKVFPEINFIELPPTHSLYHQKFKFSSGLPKVHEHDGKRPQGLALIWKGRMVCFYSYESDLGNGWEDAGTYPGDSPARRAEALKMGANLIQYVFTQ